MSYTLHLEIPNCPDCAAPINSRMRWHHGYVEGSAICGRYFTATFSNSVIRYRVGDEYAGCLKRQLDQKNARITQHSHEHIHINDPMDLIAGAPDDGDIEA